MPLDLGADASPVAAMTLWIGVIGAALSMQTMHDHRRAERICSVAHQRENDSYSDGS